MTAEKLKLPPLDVVKVLEDAGVIQKYMDMLRSLLAKLPAGMQPTDGQLDNLFSEAMQSAPGVIRAAIAVLPLQLANLALTGKSKVTKDSSALA